MSDLDETSKLLETSVRLQSAADALARMVEGTAATGTEKDALEWAGMFMGSVEEHRFSATGRLMVQATVARPVFYATIVRLAQRLAEEGLTSDRAIQDFLHELQKLLRSSADVQLAPSRLAFAASFLHEFSLGLLSDLQGDSLPRRSPLMK